MLHYDAALLAGAPGHELDWPDQDTDCGDWALALENRVVISDGVPSTDKQTLVATNAGQWELARREELQACAQNNTWVDLVQAPPGKKVVNLGFIYNVKASLQGQVSISKSPK